ncbi:MAG: efflux RND transporter periplasmic adaptor subunit [Cyanophyceae cyanobacterium]
METRLGKLHRPLPWILGAMAGGVIVVGVATYLAVEAPSAREKLQQLTVPVEQQNLTVEITANGTVEPIQSVNISPENPGRLVQLLVEQGARVQQGQPLAVMKNDQVQAQGVQAQANLQEAIAAFEQAQVTIPGEVQQLQARLQQAQANLQEARSRIPQEVAQTEAQVAAAESRYRLAGERVRRYRYLVEEGAEAQDRLDEALDEYRNAEAGLFEARKRLEQTQSTARPEVERLQAAVNEAQIALAQRQQSANAEIAQRQAAAESARANLENVKIQYRDTIITAPFDGIVTQTYATAGAFVTPTTSASSTASATSSSILALAKGLEVVAKVPEVDVGQLQPGQAVRITADAYPNQVFQGQVKQVAPEAIVEQNVTSFEVTVALLTGQEQLRSKMNVDVTFLGREISEALVVPTVAIVTEEGETGVMVPDASNKPEFKPVTIGLTLEDQTQILSGLTAEDRVFIDLPEERRFFWQSSEE